jgi:hypothetical protein
MLTKKGIRLILGVLMSVSFVNLALTLYFLAMVSIRIGSLPMAGLVFFGYNYLYIPCVFLIIVCYLLLTRVWKFDENH